ncbi:hypothetical protein E1I18_01315 [Mycoplasmopsis mucosicanis]|uniref:Uncharacterized protein n=1 Tax=Mycoplasmopsis mucosicanis TaxID=458208 RepID=A0A507SUT6_9BACT|nr:hypothetical protein [Mycoplasmopsis mucosicanis]TQC53954.1 hypothetical protein E1I18_01315 [Mycoplasmopsis mucosicanis]
MKTKNNSILINKWQVVFLIFGLIVLLTSLSFVIADVIQYDANDEIQNGIPTIYAAFKQAGTIFYFTYLSNFFLGVMLVIVAFIPNSIKLKRVFFVSVALITVTFIIYWALLSWNKKTWETVYSGTRSTITHALNPILGFIALFLVRKTFSLDSKVDRLAISIVIIYFVFTFVLFFASRGKYTSDNQTGVVVYSFLNFNKPLFYPGGKLGTIIILDIVIFLLGFLIPWSLCVFWRSVYKIPYTGLLKQYCAKRKKMQKKDN